MNAEEISRRALMLASLATAGPALAWSSRALAAPPTGGSAMGDVPARAPGDDGLEWEQFVAGLQPLGDLMRKRVPERLRGDPQVMAEAMRLLLAGIMRASSDALVGDRRHPMFVPELNIAQNIFQPNADTIYKAALIDQGGSYVIAGSRGTTRMMILAQLGPDTQRTGIFHPARAQGDFDTLKLDAGGNFSVMLSPEKPVGYIGDWWPLDPLTEKLMVRVVSCDWGNEREPRFGIDRLDVPPVKRRRPAAVLNAAYAEIPVIARNCALAFTTHVQELRAQGYINRLKVFDVSQMSGLRGQSYYEGTYELEDDEALITEVKLPSEWRYWSIILTDELYETTDWYNNQSSLNDVQARPDADGVFRAVISARDPGVHNWLDTSGYPRGAVQGRWFGANVSPTPSVRKVKVGDVMAYLPATTIRVTPPERDVALRARRLAAQRRVIW